MQEARVAIHSDSDIITARERGRMLAEHLGCTGSRLTLISTIISEAARKIRAHSLPGEIAISIARQGRAVAITIVVRVHMADKTIGVDPSPDWKFIHGLEETRTPEKTVLQWTGDCKPREQSGPQLGPALTDSYELLGPDPSFGCRRESAPGIQLL